MGGQFHFVHTRSSAVKGCVIFLVCFHNIERFIIWAVKGLQLLEINRWLNSGSVKQDRPTDKEECLKIVMLKLINQ